MQEFCNYINNVWCRPTTGQYYELKNPGDCGDVLGRFPLSAEADVDWAIDCADAAFKSWSRLLPDQRAQYVKKFLTLLEANVQQVGETLCREQGKTIGESVGEAARSVKEGQYVLGEATRLAGISLPSERPNVTNTVVRVPIGVVAAITPWNFPVLTPIRKILPALIAGCTVLLKPAYDTPLCGIALMKLFEEAGFPAGVVNMVIGKGSVMGDAISRNEKVKGISFTGSTAVGRHINVVAAEHFAKMQLEMGGKNPALVAGYHDLAFAAKQICAAAFANAGQRCTAISRVIVLEEQADELEALLKDIVRAYTVGYGFDKATQIGPVINETAGKSIMQSMSDAQAEGAKIAVGGRKLTGGCYDNGFYIEPTLIVGVRPDMRIAREEVFGPVLAVIRVRTLEEGIAVCNDTPYGLAAAVFAEDQSTIHKFANEIESGMVHINHGSVSESFMPFGGVKNSGHGQFGIGLTNKDFFTTWKVIYNQYEQ